MESLLEMGVTREERDVERSVWCWGLAQRVKSVCEARPQCSMLYVCSTELDEEVKEERDIRREKGWK